MSEAKIWRIHGGATGDADPLFLQHNVVAIGWVEMGDPGKLKADREAFKAAVIAAYPGIKPGAIPNYAGQVFRFVHERRSAISLFIPQSAIGTFTSHEYRENIATTRP